MSVDNFENFRPNERPLMRKLWSQRGKWWIELQLNHLGIDSDRRTGADMGSEKQTV